MGKKVVLDPGHFAGHNRGAAAGYAEGTAMYGYALRLADKLRVAGVDVVLTRKDVQDNPTLTQRGRMAKGADMFLSLHSNGASASSARGVSVFYSIKRLGDQKTAEAWSAALAELINGGTRDRGAHTRKGSGDWDYYTVIQSAAGTDCPRILLVEHGFHSNSGECAWLMDEANMEAMAAVECRLVLGALGVTEPSEDGRMATGWHKGSDGRWRYHTGDGAILRAQWIKDGGKWYRAMEDGTMAEGWAKIDGKWYYLEPGNGAMVTGDREIYGKTYHFDDTGEWHE